MTWLTAEGEGETSTRSANEISLKGFWSLILSRGKIREEMNDNSIIIIIDEILIHKDAMVGAQPLSETKARGSHTSLPRGQTNLTPSKVIACLRHI
jgi:hypothetical protein